MTGEPTFCIKLIFHTCFFNSAIEFKYDCDMVLKKMFIFALLKTRVVKLVYRTHLIKKKIDLCVVKKIAVAIILLCIFAVIVQLCVKTYLPSNFKGKQNI